ncbi:uncharacterized protein LOC134838174 [Culicoides brevitarsis]|uniref:uncharacterized protein LOC134838174 n=1 Tax=Culicoides brevitarsis TaxID=469753 RepID=UPI00307BAEDD
MSEKKLKTIKKFDTVYCADSVEWCPHEDNQYMFLCGTYQLEDSPKSSQFDTKCKRKGRIYIFNLKFKSKPLDLVYQLETNAILDQKWHPREPLFATADSKGVVTLYKLSPNLLEEVSKVNLDPENGEILALSLDWSPDGTKIIVSDSKGGINVIANTPNGLQLVQNHPSVHSFEAWTCIFDKNDPNVVYTGGDDTFLNCYDTRTDFSLKWRNKSHGAGVTSLLSFAENALISGSYDDNLRFFDTRQVKRAVFEKNLGGGIWRIKKNARNELLTANMYHNFTVLEVNDDNFDITASYFKHKSICYGADWCPVEDKKGCQYIATCSFYDHLLCVAKYGNKDDLTGDM